MKLQTTGMILILMSLLASSFAGVKFAEALLPELSVGTDKPSCTYRQKITILGNLTQNGLPSAGLAAIQVSDPSNRPVVMRTTSLGNTTSSDMEILTATPCNSTGNPKNVFARETRAHVNVTVKSNMPTSEEILITVFACDNDSTPILPEVMQLKTTVLPNGIISFKPDIYVASWASIGKATFHVNIYSDWPASGGRPYGFEKIAPFMIAQGEGQEYSETAQSTSDNQSQGAYALSFRLSPYAPFGTYVVNATAYTQEQITYASTTFTHPYQITGDVNFDHVINILDIVQIAAIYGTTSGNPLWNPEMDISPDGKIDITDIVTASTKYATKYNSIIYSLSSDTVNSANHNTEASSTQCKQPESQQKAYIEKTQAVITGIDIYTQYPDPYNGKGLNVPSDMFWPQKEVRVNALVIYNLWPQQQRFVSFQVIDPHGQTRSMFYNITNGDGLTFIEFRLPWPCEDPENFFGEWTVVASADVEGTVYLDTLHFRYDYRLRLWSDKLIADKPSYDHEEMIHLKIEYGTQSMQSFPATFTVTAVDELGVPFSFEWASNWIGNAQYGAYANYTISLNLYIPKFAYAEVATIYVEALKSPQSGETLCPGCNTPIGIEPN